MTETTLLSLFLILVSALLIWISWKLKILLNQINSNHPKQSAQDPSGVDNFLEQFAILRDLTELSSRVSDLKHLLQLILDKVLSAGHARVGTIMMLNPSGNGLEIMATHGWTPNVLGPIGLDETLAGRVIETGEPLVVENVEQAGDLHRQNDATRYQSPSFMILPLKTSSATTGVVCLSEKLNGKPFSHDESRYLMVLLDQVCYAVENARQLQQAIDEGKVLSDLVQRQKLQIQDIQRQMLHAGKLSALGQLIAGVAHELNNPLASVMGYLRLVEELPDKNQGVEKLAVAAREAARAAKIVQNLLSFARERKPEKTPVNLNELVQAVVELRAHDLKSRDIDIMTSFDPALPMTVVDVDQIQQVLLNLINNSVQAMSHRPLRQIRVGTAHQDNQIQLWVADTGHGIPGAILDRVFDPFFSTKAGKTNSGLGLSITKGIIDEHEGSIAIESTEGKGTRVTVSLPVITPAPLPDTHPQPEPHPEKLERVNNLFALSVDDEEALAELVAEILTQAGFHVDICHDGHQAFERLSHARYDLVVCDLRMPGMDGKRLYREVVQIEPRMKSRFIFTTGDTADPEARNFMEHQGVLMIAKPFDPLDLMQLAIETVQKAQNASN